MNLVLDTNVVIDWLVFDDPYMNPLRDAVRDRRVVLITHPPAIEELRRVLAYPALRLPQERQGEVFQQYVAGTSICTATVALPGGFPRCRDPDDDHFLILAYRARAAAVVSRDKAVLKVGKRCRKFGFMTIDVQQMMAAIPAAAD